MQIGELFIKLGITGADKTVGELKGVGKGMQTIASDSLAAKAAILGAMYATQQLFSKSGQTGTNLTNFNALIGMSTKTLQQYQYAARQAGVANEETTGTFKNLQTIATDIFSGKGVPAGFQRLQAVTGILSQEDISRAMENPEKLFKRLNEYALKEKNVGLRNQTLRSFGLSDQMIAGMARNSFRPDVMNKAPTYGEGEIAALDKANIAWSNLNTKIEMAVGHFNALHGGQLVKDISMVADQVLVLAEAFMKLAEKIQFFEGLSKVFEGWAEIFKGVGSVVDTVTKIAGGGAEGEKAKGQATGFLSDVASGFMQMVKETHFGGANPPALLPAKGTQAKPMPTTPTVKPGGVFSAMIPAIKETAQKQGLLQPSTAKKGTAANPTVVKTALAKKGKVAPDKKANLKLVSPSMSQTMTAKSIAPNVAPVGPQASVEKNVTVNQTLNFNHKVDEPKVTADHMQRQVDHALRQNPALQQVN